MKHLVAADDRAVGKGRHQFSNNLSAGGVLFVATLTVTTGQ